MKRNSAKANSLSRSSRLSKKSDFLRLRKSAKKLVSRHWIVFYLKNELEMARLAITASTRYGNAVRRNHFKRWIREKFRKNKGKFNGYDLHFVAKSTRNAENKELVEREMQEDFLRLLRSFS